MSKVIVFQGDSITDAGRNREFEGANIGLGVGYPVLVSSELLATEVEKNWEIYNRGISGNRVVDLYARWKKDTLNLKPDILSILIGVNDTWHEFLNQNGVEVPRYEEVYRMLLKWTREVLPDVKLVIIEPFALLSEVVQESWIPEINERRAVARKLADEFGAVFIPAQSILDEAVKKAPGSYWLRDGVHPTPAGHHLLARAWIEATENIR